MTETNTNPPPILPSADEFAVSHQHRVYVFALLALGVAFASGISFVLFGSASLIMSGLFAVVIVTLVAIWQNPAVTFYILFAGTTVFELTSGNGKTGFIEAVPFFWNFNTVAQLYAHTNVKEVPLNLVEALIFAAAICAGIRAVYYRQGKILLGPLFWPIAVYISFVILSWINGMWSGGDFKISLQEVRPQVYFFLAYLMGANIVSTPLQVQRVYWVTALGIGFKGIYYTIRRYTDYAALPLPDGGVGSHEEAFFFDCFVMLLLVLSMCGIQKRLKTMMWILAPFVVLGELATNRRAGTAAIIIAFPILLLLAHRALPNRRKIIALFSLTIAILFPLYYMAFRHSSSMLAQPARAVASQFEPNDRDAASNAYRDAENVDLMATIHIAPLQGYGYGKRMLHVVPIADISKQYDWWDIMTHNQILWVWMRVGTFGMIAFWMMVSATIIQGCQTVRSETANVEAKAVAIFSTVVITMLMFFGLLDLQLSNYRDMLFTGFWAGILVAAGRFAPTQQSVETAK